MATVTMNNVMEAANRVIKMAAYGVSLLARIALALERIADKLEYLEELDSLHDTFAHYADMTQEQRQAQQQSVSVNINTEELGEAVAKAVRPAITERTIVHEQVNSKPTSVVVDLARWLQEHETEIKDMSQRQVKTYVNDNGIEASLGTVNKAYRLAFSRS